MKCEICDKSYDNITGLSIHLVKKHHLNNNQLKDYYDKYLKKDNEGKCYFCGENAIFKSISNGYHKICNSDECLGKTRATGTYEFLMYKYDLSKDDAIKMMNDRAIDRGIKIKNGLNKKYINNNNFFKEKSHQSKEYWIKRGYTENDAIKKVKDVCNMIHNKTWEKRRKHPELYNNVNTTQLKYWLKKGYTDEESKMKLSDRQKTFSLKICIEKYGEEDGKKRWMNRQLQWIKNNKKNNFSKISQELFWKIYELINLSECDIYFATLKDNNIDNSGKNNEYKLKLIDSVISPDFFIKNKNKIIEFDGTYYHRNTSENKKREYLRDKDILDCGYELLHIKENDYRQNKEKVIQECIDFIKK
jgi:uncharacterized protein YaeQ